MVVGNRDGGGSRSAEGLDDEDEDERGWSVHATAAENGAGLGLNLSELLELVVEGLDRRKWWRRVRREVVRVKVVAAARGDVGLSDHGANVAAGLVEVVERNLERRARRSGAAQDLLDEPLKGKDARVRGVRRRAPDRLDRDDGSA